MIKFRMLTTGMLLFLVNFVAAHGTEISWWQTEGKIRVVIGVITLVFLGILLFLVLLERRLSRLEKQLK
jgi:hypothetical protein